MPCWAFSYTFTVLAIHLDVNKHLSLYYSISTASRIPRHGEKLYFKMNFNVKFKKCTKIENYRPHRKKTKHKHKHMAILLSWGEGRGGVAL